MKVPKIIYLLAFYYLLFSCEEKEITINKDSDNKKNVRIDTLSINNDFLFNVPVVTDTIFIDKQYNIDIRIELKDYSIDSIKIMNNGRTVLTCDTTIISSKNLYFYENPVKVEFLIRSVNIKNRETVYFKSKPMLFKTVENLSDLYVFNSITDGRLKLTWEEFDKSNTQKYLVERWMIDDQFGQYYGIKKYYHSFETENAIFFDNYYVGEEVEYKITVINNDGNQQDIWYYKKSKEQSNLQVTQNSVSGYNFHFSKCKYYNNFGQYYLTTGLNYNPEFLHSTSQINDTTYHMPNAKFGEEVRFWLQYLPKKYPDGFLEKDWYIYGKYLYTQCGITSIEYRDIVVLNNNYCAYTAYGKIFKYNVTNNQVVDSIVNQGEFYELLKASPDGKYIYSINRNHSNPIPTIYFWSTSFSENSIYNFSSYSLSPVSNNLLTIINSSSGKLAIYNVISRNIIYTTNYEGSSNYPTISPDGDYLFLFGIHLTFGHYANNLFEIIWVENNWTKYYLFYNFNRLNNDLCYIWDDNKTFSIRKTSDFSVINSFPLQIEAIVDIDYYSNKIMGYVTDKVVIYNLNTGNLLKEIPANLSELFFYSNKTVLLGNTIYNNHGIKYELNQ